VRAWPVQPGVSAAGHVTSGAAWHPGPIDGCDKCDQPVWTVVLRRSNGRFARSWPARSKYDAKQVRDRAAARYDAGFYTEIRRPDGTVLNDTEEAR
jgi:hypothetical protein